MKWKCETCGHELTGEEQVCPECGTTIVYKCVKCGKELKDGKHEYCPLCLGELAEKKKSFWDNVVKAAVAVGGVAVVVLSALGSMHHSD